MKQGVEVVPETEITSSEVHGVSTNSNVASGTIRAEEATQPPTNITHSMITTADRRRDFTQATANMCVSQRWTF